MQWPSFYGVIMDHQFGVDSHPSLSSVPFFFYDAILPSFLSIFHILGSPFYLTDSFALSPLKCGFLDLTLGYFLYDSRYTNGNPLQCSCLENPRDRGAWWAAVYGAAQSDLTEAT